MKHAVIFSVNNWHLIRNLGAHKIATWLRHHDWDVEVVDYSGHWPSTHLQEFCKSRITSNTEFIGFSDTWGIGRQDSEKFNQLIEFVKNKFPRIKTIVGSQNLSTTIINADYFIEGYAEFALLEVIKNIIGTENTPLKYTLFRNGKLVRGADYPAIFMHDLWVDYQSRDFIKPNEQLGIELSRGCKFQCDFCNYFPLRVKGDNFRPVTDYINNIKYLNETYGTTVFYGADSTMNVNNEKIKLFADASQQLKFNPWICGFTRLDLLTSHKDIWDSMIAMGYVGHHYGIETFDHQSGKAIGKGMHPDKIKHGVIEIQKYFASRSKYRATISLIAGLPYETMDSIKEGINWIYNNLPEEHVVVYPLFIPHPTHSDQTQKSLFSVDCQKYGYKDSSPEKQTAVDWNNGLDWKNDNTGVTYQEVKSFVEHDELISKKLMNRTPWLIGELMELSNTTLDVALQMKSTRNQTYQIYHNEARKFVSEYIKDKLNYVNS